MGSLLLEGAEPEDGGERSGGELPGGFVEGWDLDSAWERACNLASSYACCSR
jgi:hypothetical protein